MFVWALVATLILTIKFVGCVDLEFKDAEKRINSLMKFGMKLGLERIRKLLNLIGNPQNNLKFIHVAGTNGKGSACTMTASILTQAGYKTGLFISPYITCFRERMQISNRMISENEISEILDEIMPIVEKMAEHHEFITEFELITAIALKWFSDNNCDIVVLEVGLGGRFDATNVIDNPIISVIMSISLDHTSILGDKIEQIAFEKSGIIKPKSTTIIYPEQKEKALKVILKVAREQKNKIIVPELSKIKIITSDIYGTRFKYKNMLIELPFVGEHQIKNVSVVLSIIAVLREYGMKISNSDLILGLKNAKHPARFELISKNPLVILDGSHNPDGVKSLALILNKNLADKKLFAIIGMLQDKDVESSLKILGPLFSEIIVTSPNNPRALPADKLCDIAVKFCKNVKIVENKQEAVNYSLSKLCNETALVICGSLYLASEIRPVLIETLNNLQK